MASGVVGIWVSSTSFQNQVLEKLRFETDWSNSFHCVLRLPLELIDFFSSLAACTTDAHCQTKDTTAKCIEAYTGLVPVANNECKCTDVQDLTPDCSG